MRSSGNGSTDVCTANLLRCVRTEVPYQRLKGLNPRLIDKPFVESADEIKQDAQLVIEIFEPRVTVNSVNIDSGSFVNGGLTISADVTERSE